MWSVCYWHRQNIQSFTNFPSTWYFPKEFTITILHFHVLIKSFSHGILDDNLLTFIQQVYHLLLHGNGFVDFRGGGVEVTDNGILLFHRR